MAELAKLHFKKLIDLREFPSEWRVVNLSFDWNGSPLVLIEDGKPPMPKHAAVSAEELARWMNSPPKAHHLIYWSDGQQQRVTFAESTGIVSNCIQRFGAGWLLANNTGGLAEVYDVHGKLRGRRLNLGDAIEDLQTTSDGHIWVSYFDEGIFGSGIATSGLVCFDSSGEPVFKYAEFAERHNLPFVADLYALNVSSDDDVWICYYSDFPLVRLTRFELAAHWPAFGKVKSLAIEGTTIIAVAAYEKDRIIKAELAQGEWRTTNIEAVDERGAPIQGCIISSARMDRIGLVTSSAAYLSQSF
jgi:hypothetical protein